MTSESQATHRQYAGNEFCSLPFCPPRETESAAVTSRHSPSPARVASGALPIQRGRPTRSAVDSSESTSRNVRVQVRSQYIPERSAPPRHQWFFAYRIRIANEGAETIQLLTRHWIITDARGHVEEVNGEGVVGEQPVLEPGESFEYTSGCPLTTPFGSMRGEYQMVNREGEQFDVAIPEFVLIVPGAMN